MTARRIIEKDWLIQKFVTENLTVAQIRKLLGCGSMTVRKSLEVHGIPTHRQMRPYSHKDWLVREYIEKKRSISEIAQECDAGVSYVSYFLDKFGIWRDDNRRKRYEHRIPQHTNYTDREWLYDQYVNQKKTFIQIATECGVAKATIKYWLYKLEVPTRHGSEAMKLRE